MTTPRKKKRPTTRPRTANSPSAKKRAPSKSLRAASDHEDIFIPKRGTPAPAPKLVAVKVFGDDAIFVARPGPPVIVQADIEDDIVPHIPAPGIVQQTIPGAGAEWTLDELRDHGFARDHRGRVECRFGCTGLVSPVPGVSEHTYNCEYWRSPEGRTKTPF